ncbi:MAG: caspase family protein, partial [Deltaproteobacteria bacterium]|nr:caspase family protein [Deltaproteobacteria bacterium]
MQSMRARTFRIALVALGFVLALLAPRRGQAQTEPPVLRLAVVVGANAAPAGRARLRYAHKDAQAVADVLVQTGGFLPENVRLLTEPQPAQVIEALENALAQAGKVKPTQALLLFYYSGHADPDALYPSGRRLAVSDLRIRMQDTRALLRMGIIDACRGGGWTGSKGLREAAPFDVDVPNALTSEGAILISSSSGAQNAHESEFLGGSFFTHHWNAGLRGAGDHNDDGLITINEAFAYAREMTVRDTARLASEPQNPSFHMDVKGRDDLVLSALDRPRALLMLRQDTGPLQLVDLRSGIVLLETQRGPKRLRLALPAGKYLVRRQDNGAVWSRDVALGRQGNASVEEGELVRGRDQLLADKSFTAGESTIVAPGSWNLQLALGVRHAPVIDPGLRLVASDGAAGLLRVTYGLAPRWHLALPLALAYGGGQAHGLEWIPWFGMPVVGFSRTEAQGIIVNSLIGAGVDFRWHQVPRVESFNISLAAFGAGQWAEQAAARKPFDTWTALSTVGASWDLRGIATFNLGGGVAKTVMQAGLWQPAGELLSQEGLVVAVGSVQRRALRPLPLV